MGLAVVGGFLFGCGHATDGEVIGVIASPLRISADISISTVKGAALTSTVLASTQDMTFAPGSTVSKPNSGDGPFISSLGKLRAEPDARLSDLFSKGAVDLRDRVHVFGSVHAATLTRAETTLIDGTIDRTPTLDPLNVLSWHVEFPSCAAPGINVEPGKTSSISPGRFGSVRVGPRATLNLKSGTYYMSQLDLEPQSGLRLDQGAGPVVLYVSDDLKARGSFTSRQAGEIPDLAVIYLGGSAIKLDAPFQGSLVAPNASVTIGPSKTPFEGFFFARSLSVAPHTTVKFRPPLSLLAASGSRDLEACARAIPVRTDLQGKAKEVAYQKDIARYCSMRGGNSCQLDLTSRVNVDYTAAAFRLITEQASPGEYLALVRDRTRKLRAAEDDPSLSQLLCAETDKDDDLVPDARDNCPTTPALTPTDKNGCTDTVVPDAPSAADVKVALAASPIVFAPQCSGAAPLPKLPAGGFYYPAERGRGTFILSARVRNQPAGCPVFYYFDIETLDASGVVIERYLTAFNAIEEVTALIGTSSPVPPGYIQFNARPGDPGTRNKLGNAGGTNIRYRVAAMNGMGSFGGWSEWKFTTNDDCAALGFKCGG